MAHRSTSAPRDKNIMVRVTVAEKAQIAANAKAVNLDVSDYLRSLALTSTPEVAAYASNLNNSLSGLAAAVSEAQSLLGQNGG